MPFHFVLRLAIAISCATTIAACQTKNKPQDTDNAATASNVTQEKAAPTSKAPAPLYKPTANPAIKKDPKIEARIKEILGLMTLEQKVGQMIQVRIGEATLEEIAEYGVGSILNGGGQTPNENADSTAAQWAQYAEERYQASVKVEGAKVQIPLIWGTDAVHGHNNVKGAVLYPHNIGLGATHNTQLVQDIAKATAESVAATGIDWNFAPTVATARDYRWGRTYESFSEDPQIVAEMGAIVVKGLQGEPNTKEFLNQSRVIATAKHFIGDGGTAFGDDQGYTYGREEKLLKLHLPGYISAIESGVQTIMASYSFWNGTHSHANKDMLTGLLKDQLKFDGLVVSDWQALPHIEGCTLDSCAESINAGVDVFMIPNAPDWQNFHRNTIKQVKDGTIPMARIDDAVSRILRVKLRAGLWNKPSPAQRKLAGKQTFIGSKKNRELARQAVRESLVLLKNNNALPLNPRQTILIAGDAANNISVQAGGWSVSWQGKDNKNELYQGATSIFKGFESAITAAGGKAILSETGDTNTKIDAAIVVFGEDAYAEMYGDIQNMATLELEQTNKKSLQLLKKLKAKNVPVIAVLLSGRPLWVNKELNVADAFVAAWLPGSEGQGIADVVLAKPDGNTNYNFKGRLSFSWPLNACDAALNKGDANYSPLFPLGFGLSYKNTTQNWVALNEDTSQWTFGCRLRNKKPDAKEVTFNKENNWDFYIEQKNLSRKKVDGAVSIGSLNATLNPSLSGSVKATWDGTEEGRLNLRNDTKRNDFIDALANNSAVVFDINIDSIGEKPLKAVLYSSHLTGNTIDISELFKEQAKNQWVTLSIDLRCFANIRADMNKVSIPFGLHSDGKHQLSIGNIRYEPNKGSTASMSCPN